jgi:hypothetical protein
MQLEKMMKCQQRVTQKNDEMMQEERTERKGV